MILVFIGFNLNLKVGAGVYTSKANPPAIFHGFIPEKISNKSTAFLRNTTRRKDNGPELTPPSPIYLLLNIRMDTQCNGAG